MVANTPPNTAELGQQKHAFPKFLKPRAGDRIRTVDLRITSASPENLPESGASQDSQNPCKIETSETEEKPEEP